MRALNFDVLMQKKCKTNHGPARGGGGHRPMCPKYATVLGNRNEKAQLTKGYARQRRHSKMAVSRHLGYYRTGNSAIRFEDPKNPRIEPDIEWIGCTVSEIFAFKLYSDLENGVQGHSRSSKVALFDRARTTLYSSSIVTMPLSSILFKI